MSTGFIKWYSDSKGFGFIEDGDGRSVFLHYSAIVDKGHILAEGTEVNFDLVETDRGPEAALVSISSREET